MSKVVCESPGVGKLTADQLYKIRHGRDLCHALNISSGAPDPSDRMIARLHNKERAPRTRGPLFRWQM